MDNCCICVSVQANSLKVECGFFSQLLCLNFFLSVAIKYKVCGKLFESLVFESILA